MSTRTAARPWTRRIAAAAVVTAALATAGLSTPAPAKADSVASAQHRVDVLLGRQAAVTQRLLDGTRKWEADQARLARLQLQLRNTERHVAEQQAVVDDAVAHVDLIARRMYMRPVTEHLQLAFTQSPQSALDALQAQAAVARVAGADGQVILAAKQARLALRRDQAQVEAYAADAKALERASAARLAGLKRLAADTAQQLVQAQTALASARAELAARQARERASRLRAAAAAAAAAAASRSAGGGAACTSRSTAGQSNGNLDPASLCPLWRAPGHRLRWDAANAFNRMSQYHAATLGTPLCVTDSYRSYSEQVDVYQRKPGLAAVPGTSNHGWGLAVDFCGGIERAGTPAHQWMQANAGRFGWFHPDWAEPSGSKPEAWHWEFRG